jgi:ribosomal protein L7/L12
MAHPDFDKIVVEAAESFRASGAIEPAIRHMRESGLNPLDCMKAVMSIQGVGLGEAKRIVHFSDTWSDIRADQEELQRVLAEEVEPDH